MPLDDAVTRAADECIAEGILEGFLRKNKAEVIKMSIYEYDEELHMEVLREESEAKGEDKVNALFRFCEKRMPRQYG